MNRGRAIPAFLCAIVVLTSSHHLALADLSIPGSALADDGNTRWSVSGGDVSITLAESNAAARGLRISLDAPAGDPNSPSRRVEIDPLSTLVMMQLPEGGGMQFEGALVLPSAVTFNTRSGHRSLPGFILRMATGDSDGSAALEFAAAADGSALLRASIVKIGMDRASPALLIESPALVVTSDLAAELGRPDLEGLVVGSIEARPALAWIGGLKPRPVDPDITEQPEESFGGDPRAATICPGQPGASVGADVIVGELFDVLSYGSETVGGVPIAAFAVGTISCNLGSVPLQWFTSGNGGAEIRHPVIGQNLFRLKTLPDGSSRFDQVGQSWLKHAFTALQDTDCCSNCTATGGTTLGIGCSDPYTASLNGGQSSAGPKYQVNGFTGIQVHPVASPAFSGTVARRLQVKIADLDPALDGGGLYFVEGQYQAGDDATAGNQRNNASYRRVDITGSGSSWTMALHPSGTQRMEAGIRAWKDQVPDVVETDVNISSEGLVIVAARAAQTNGGLWHYEYAVQNLCSDRSVGSFSVPINPAASVSNIGFNDVPYRNGEPFDGTDWPGSFAGGQVQWMTTAHAVNANANAIRWGTMYSFRFDANTEPTTGNVTLGVFKPGSPSSAAASSIVPGNLVALSISVLDPLPALVPPCTPVSFDVRIQPGTQTVVSGSEKLLHRFDGGAFIESSLTPLGGENYQAKVPAAFCGDVPQFYVQAQGSGGATVKSPLGAPGSVYAYQVGVPQTGVLLDVDFNSGVPVGWAATGLWNVTNLCPVLPLCGDGTYAYYGNTGTCTFETGAANSGTLTAPPMTLSSTGTITLSYCSNLQTENFSGYDRAEVRLNGTLIDTASESAAWQTRTVNLTPYAGQTVTLVFSFNTIDQISNGFRGWQIDDVQIVGDQIICDAMLPTLKGDMDANGIVDARDLEDFVSASLALSALPGDVCPGDFNENAVVEPGDVPGMVDALLNP